MMSEAKQNQGKADVMKVAVPSWAALPPLVPSEVVYEAAPLRWRFDGAAGVFLCGEYEHGPSLAVQILDRQWRDGARFGRPHQSWLDVAFVDDRRRVGTLSLKKDSATNLHFFLVSELQETARSRVNPMAVRLVLSAVSKDSVDLDYAYYTLAVGEWAFVSREEFRAANRFWESSRFSWHIPGEAGEVQ